MVDSLSSSASSSVYRDLQTLPEGLPPPDGGAVAAAIEGRRVPDSVVLSSTAGGCVELHALPGRTVIYAYPRTGVPGSAPLVAEWDTIPGARGCTPQTCGFRDHYKQLLHAGAMQVFGLSTQDTAYQREVAERLHLPFQLLSDGGLALTRSLGLPTHKILGMTLTQRITLILRDGVVEKVFYPVFPPTTSANTVLEWLKQNPLS